MNNVMSFPLRSVPAGIALMLTLSACSSLNETFSGDKVDYRAGATVKTTALEVPPDLTQLTTDSRFLPPTRTVVSASSFQSAASAPTAAAAAGAQPVAPQAVGDVRIERYQDLRWLSTSMPPEQLWPKLQAFWEERQLALTLDKPEVGVMETLWAENRAKLPNDIVRRTLGKVIDRLYSTGELDKFRVRVERTATGAEVYITHHGLEEVYSGKDKETTVWEPRPRDRNLEGEMLSLIMIKLGTKKEEAQTAVAASTPVPSEPARARLLPGAASASLQVDDGFDRAWRRVGLALDRTGFTVEDRDRGQGLYFVRYVDPTNAGKEERGFFGRLFNIGDKNEKLLARYRVSVRSEGESTTVSVQDDSGAPEKGETGQRIVKLLIDELK
jgi:outer membrane protein assembly factor BamC